MNKRVINQKADEYRAISKSLKQVRPPCHAASAISTICFVVTWITTREFFEPLLAWNPYAIYMVITLVSIPFAYYFERIVSGIIDAFATVYADNHGWKTVVGMGAVMLPLFLIAASTSLVGVKSAIKQSSSSGVADTLMSYSERIGEQVTNLTDMLSKQEQSKRAERNKLRQSLADSYDAELPIKISSCQAIYGKKNKQWYKDQCAACITRDSAILMSKKATALAEFDQETAKIMNQVADLNGKSQAKMTAGLGSAVEGVTEHTKTTIDEINWLGGFFGFATVVLLIISLLAAIMDKKIVNALVEKK